MCLKALTGGEDAFFVSSYAGGVIAVADGVSGYGIIFIYSFFVEISVFPLASSFMLKGIFYIVRL